MLRFCVGQRGRPSLYTVGYITRGRRPVKPARRSIRVSSRQAVEVELELPRRDLGQVPGQVVAADTEECSPQERAHQLVHLPVGFKRADRALQGQWDSARITRIRLFQLVRLIRLPGVKMSVQAVENRDDQATNGQIGIRRGVKVSDLDPPGARHANDHGAVVVAVRLYERRPMSAIPESFVGVDPRASDQGQRVGVMQQSADYRKSVLGEPAVARQITEQNSTRPNLPVPERNDGGDHSQSCRVLASA